MKITSSAFDDGSPIPKKHTEDGENRSPPLAWSDVPAGTRELALICDDPDAPTEEPWVHWLIYRIPSTVRELPKGLAREPTLAQPRAAQGQNGFGVGELGYRGPAPPKGHGTHHYHFKLYALDRELELAEGIEKEALLKAMEGHVLEEAELIGTYER